MALRIAIGCCNYLFSEGLMKLLEDERDIEIIGIFNEGANFPHDLSKILRLDPDVIIADCSTDFSMLLSLREDLFSRKHVKILLIGDRTTKTIANKLLKNFILGGVVGILPPSADAELLRKALRAVISGELWLDRVTLMKLLTSKKQQEKNVNLAKREKEIMFHICQGYRNKEIAQKLNISEQTVKSHCNRIYKKLGVSDRLQLALHSQKIWDINTKV